MNTPTIVVTEPLARAPMQWLADRARVVEITPDALLTHHELPRADALVVRTHTKVDKGLLDRAPQVRVIGRAGVGLDTIDVDECRRRGVEVVHTPDANSAAVVEFVLAAILRELIPDAHVREPLTPEAWAAQRRNVRPQAEDWTLGILGLGRIGRRLATAAAAIGFSSILFHDLEPRQHPAAESVTREELLARSDVLSVHVDGRATNADLLSAAAFASMRRDVLLINTSRGHVIDAAALAAFLNQRLDAGFDGQADTLRRSGPQAVLDVHPQEPFGADYPLLGVPGATLTPHIASRTDRALEAMSWVVRDVVAVLEGQAPRHPAPPSLGTVSE